MLRIRDNLYVTMKKKKTFIKTCLYNKSAIYLKCNNFERQTFLMVKKIDVTPIWKYMIMCYPILQFTNTKVNQYCISWGLFAGHQQNTPMVELNGYEQRPIAALINHVLRS